MGCCPTFWSKIRKCLIIWIMLDMETNVMPLMWFTKEAECYMNKNIKNRQSKTPIDKSNHIFFGGKFGLTI